MNAIVDLNMAPEQGYFLPKRSTIFLLSSLQVLTSLSLLPFTPPYLLQILPMAFCRRFWLGLSLSPFPLCVVPLLFVAFSCCYLASRE